MLSAMRSFLALCAPLLLTTPVRSSGERPLVAVTAVRTVGMTVSN